MLGLFTHGVVPSVLLSAGSTVVSLRTLNDLPLTVATTCETTNDLNSIICTSSLAENAPPGT